MKVYVHTIDGIECWIPVDVREVSSGRYLILDTEEFDPEDASTLLQFIPGDVVRVEDDKAVELISSSAHDRGYWGLLFDVASGNPPNVDVTKPPYSSLLEKISEEISRETRWHYPAVREWVRAQRQRVCE